MRRAAVLVIALAAAVTGGCGTDETGTLFPLDPGHRWTYDLRIEGEGDAVEHETRVLETLDAQTLDDGRAFRRRSDSGVDYWLRRDATGIYRVASKSDLQAEPQRDKERRYVLKAPYAVGTGWRADTTAYLLRRRQEFPREIRHSHPAIPMHYTIEAVDQTVGVRAGTFAGCVRVRGSAAVRLFADPVAGWTDLPLTTTEWYCPGVGLVKLVRDEPAASGFLTGGRLTMELAAFR
jgi:hypothetical protein